ncbi:MAG: phage holin family protein [Bacteroidales bacterium]|nr:phage holin family protein [Bacteroidales bacterium]
MEESLALTATKGAYSVIFATFLQESIGHMIPWLVVAFCVILCDLVVGVRKSLILGEEVRFSSACRRSIGKTVSYFTFVIMAAVVDVAANGGGTIDKWSCLMVCFIEGCSIISNILKPKGISLNLVKMIAVVFSKKFDVAKQDIEEIIEKEDGRHN